MDSSTKSLDDQAGSSVAVAPVPLEKLGSFSKMLGLLPRPVSSLSVLDIGCGGGHFLAYFGEGSVGLELSEVELERCRALGETVYRWSFTDPMPAEIEDQRFDVAFLSHFIEHVFSPHVILMEARRHLKPGGLVVIACPMLNCLSHLSYRISRRFGRPNAPGIRGLLWHRGFHTALYGDHVNFFTHATLRYTCEFAGFETLYMGTPYLPKPLSWLARPIWPTTWYIGKKREDFQYDQSAACKKLDEEGKLAWRI